MFLKTIDGADGFPRLLEAPVIISIRRTAQAVVYPLFYKQPVNNQPHEDIRAVSLFEEWSSTPCGGFTDSNGQVIPSSGIICSLFTTNSPLMRNGRPGNLFGQVYTHSCLRFDSIWYDAFEVGLSRQSGTVFVDVSVLNATTRTRTNFTLSLDTSSMQAATPDGLLVAELVGTFAAYRAVPDLTNMMFFFPTRPVGGERQKEGFEGSMLLPLSLVDLTGRSPNKVGVSFEGFAKQGSACENPAGSGLSDQLDSWYKQDVLRRTAGLPPRYFASPTFRFGRVNQSAISFALIYWVPDPPNVLVSYRRKRKKKDRSHSSLTLV